MSSFEDARQSLQNVLNNYSPSFIINKGCAAIFHGFFARCSVDEAIQFLPPHLWSMLQNFQSKHVHDCPQPLHLPQNIPSTPDTFLSGSNSAGTIVAGPTNPVSCEPASFPQSRPMLDKQPMNLTVLTPESFRKQAQQGVQLSGNASDVRLTGNASKLIQSIKNACKEPKDINFYEALWDNREDTQCQNPIMDPLYRYQALQRLIDVSAETEVKHVYRQRIAHILGAHEVEIIGQSISECELSRGVTRQSLVVDKLSKSLGEARKVIHQHNTKRRHYLSFYFKLGPGAIPLLGDSGNKELLEKDLTDQDVTNVIEYIQKSLPNWLSLCEKINFDVATAILKGLKISGWDGRSHYNTGFMTHLGKFIDLDAFQKSGDFRPVSGDRTTAAKRSYEPNLAGDSSRKRHRRNASSETLPSVSYVHNRRLSEADITSVPSSETQAQVFSTAGPSLSQDGTPDQSRTHTVDNSDIGRNQNIDLPGPDVNGPAPEGRHQPENLDTDWTHFRDTRNAENLDIDWAELLQNLESPPENLDLGWQQFLRDVEHSSENLGIGWTQEGYIWGNQSR